MTQPLDVAYVQILPDVSEFSRRLVRDVTRALKQFEREARAAFDDVEDAAKDAGITIAVSISLGAQKAERAIDDLADSANSDFKRMSRGAVRSGAEIAGAFSLAGAGREFGAALSALGSFASTAFSSLATLAVVIVALLPALIALSAAIADLVGLAAALPATFGVLAASIAPLILAFQNFGDAVSAIASGDIDKINEALQKLSPSARKVALEFGRVLPAFRELQRAVQESFFKPLVGALTQVSKALLPSLRSGLVAVGTVLGNLAASFARFLSSPAVIQVINETFAATARILTMLGPIVGRLFSALNASVHEALPFVERLAGGFGRALDAFTSFLDKAIESGDFDRFLEEAIKSLKELFGLAKAVGGLIATLFGATDDAGRGFIATLTDVTNRLNDFLKSAEGQKALEKLVDAVVFTGQAIGGLVNVIAFLGEGFSNLLDLMADIRKSFSQGKKIVEDFLNGTSKSFSDLPDKIGEFLSSIPEKIGAAFKAAGAAVLLALGVAIGTVLFTVTQLPEEIGKRLAAIPGKIKEALSGTGPSMLEIFSNALDTVGNFITTKFDELINFIASIPDRISELGPKLLQAGKNLIKGFFAGLSQAGSFVSDVAGNIVGALKNGLNKAIDKVNEGIAAVDNVLPGTLPRIPRLAKGGIIPATPGGQLFVGGEAGEDEVVAPLSKFEKMMGGGTVINVGANAFNIIFEGTVPTESQARATGHAVADGWLAELARRNVRLETRAI